MLDDMASYYNILKEQGVDWAERPFLIDVNEPKEVINKVALAKGITFRVAPLNARTHSDYVWTKLDEDGELKTVEVERKTWSEIVGDLDRVEEQMQRHFLLRPDSEHIFLLEGMAGPYQNGTQIYRESRSGLYVKGSYSRIPFQRFASWLYQCSDYVKVVPTTNLEASIITLLAMYRSDLANNHSVLHRQIKKITVNLNPVVGQFMSLFAGLGEARATALHRHYKNVYELSTAKASDLIRIEGFGPALVDSVLKQLGSPNVRN